MFPGLGYFPFLNPGPLAPHTDHGTELRGTEAWGHGDERSLTVFPSDIPLRRQTQAACSVIKASRH